MPVPSRSISAARLEFRACARHVTQRPDDFAAHAERLGVSIALPGSEPVQGALADLFWGCRKESAAHRRAALEAARSRLNRFVVRRFELYLEVLPFPQCTRLATRWSVLAVASLNIPQSALRASVDDSRLLAHAALAAWQRADETGQADFLEHCRICDDTLSFMLARRGILRLSPTLPPRWQQTAEYFERKGVAA